MKLLRKMWLIKVCVLIIIVRINEDLSKKNYHHFACFFVPKDVKTNVLKIIVVKIFFYGNICKLLIQIPDFMAVLYIKSYKTHIS